MYDFTDIIRSVELSIGTRFYFRDTLYEVALLDEDEWGCPQCEFDTIYTEAICQVMKCNGYRQDKKRIFFKKVKENKRGNND